ncbi:MAG: hypothetical protein ACI86M_000795, partial [Saprospiraceae bacterium]
DLRTKDMLAQQTRDGVNFCSGHFREIPRKN